MRNTIIGLGLLAAASVSHAGEAPKESTGVYNFEMKNIDGESVKLSRYEGDVLLIVNVASK